MTPIKSRKDRARILKVGCFSMNRLTVPENAIITATASTTAMIMIRTSEAIPTAVITESKEKTISKIMI
ncbi:hypothetical protein D3C83_317850 [compost metagenome]